MDWLTVAVIGAVAVAGSGVVAVVVTVGATRLSRQRGDGLEREAADAREDDLGKDNGD